MSPIRHIASAQGDDPQPCRSGKCPWAVSKLSVNSGPHGPMRKLSFFVFFSLILHLHSAVRGQAFYKGFGNGLAGSKFSREFLFGEWKWRSNQGESGGADYRGLYAIDAGARGK